MITFEDEKQFTKIISKVKFIIENSLGLLSILRILELAIIIRAAIKILRRINVDDRVSIEENEEIDELIWWRNRRFRVAIIVRINNDAIVIHQ